MSVEVDERTSWRWALLPGAIQPSGSSRTLRDWIVDVTLCIVAAGICLVELRTTADHHSSAAALLDLGLGVAACAGIWVRRTRPFAIAVGTGIAGIVSGAAAGAAAVALFNAALRCSRGELAIATAIGLAATAVFPALFPGDDTVFKLDLTIGALFTLGLVGWGLVVRARRDTLLSLRERAERLAAEQELQLELARTAERQRIAREMHDVLAHRISLLAVHAGALQQRHRNSPEDAAAADVIRENAYIALQELREVIGVLRERDHNDRRPEPPQPTLADIPSLIAQARDAGMRLSTSITLPTRDVALLVERTAYRIVQEGLTNARKHAPAAAVEVTVDAGDKLDVRVLSRRPVTPPTPSAPGSGVGLIGLAERVALVGGTLSHGLDVNGDFCLQATLPL